MVARGSAQGDVSYRHVARTSSPAGPSPRPAAQAAAQSAARDAKQGPVPWRDALPCHALVMLMRVATIFFNGVLNETQADVVDSTRDWATAVQAVAMLVLALVARNWPGAVHARRVTAASLAATALGTALTAVGVLRHLPTPLVAGACLTSLAIAWATALLLVMLIRLPVRVVLACLAAGDLLATPAATTLSLGGYWPCLVCYALIATALLVVGQAATADAFSAFARAEAASDAAITRPRAVLPLGHDLFVYTFAFSLAYGYALRYEHADGGLLANWFIAVVLAGVLVYALASRGPQPRADVLFYLAFALLLGGLLLVLLDSDRCALPASVALLCGSGVYDELTDLTLCAVAARNRSNALPTIAWGYAVYYLGICVGAQTGLLVTARLGGNGLAGRAVVAVLVMAFVLYALVSLRRFGFDQTIAGVEKDASRAGTTTGDAGSSAGGVERTIDLTDARCRELAASLGLTPREADVFRLRARGNNTLRIQDELGITKNTLKYHVRHIYEKAGVHSQQELIDLL